MLGHHDKERCRTSGALGHGTGPWDDVTGVVKRAIVFDDFSENFVDIDMNARRQAVDGWMASRRETQSMYWEQPTDAYRSYSSYRSQLLYVASGRPFMMLDCICGSAGLNMHIS